MKFKTTNAYIYSLFYLYRKNHSIKKTFILISDKLQIPIEEIKKRLEKEILKSKPIEIILTHSEPNSYGLLFDE